MYDNELNPLKINFYKICIDPSILPTEKRKEPPDSDTKPSSSADPCPSQKSSKRSRR